MTYCGFETTFPAIKSASFFKKGRAYISKLLNVCSKTALLCRKEVLLVKLPAVRTCQALKMFGTWRTKKQWKDAPRAKHQATSILYQVRMRRGDHLENRIKLAFSNAKKCQENYSFETCWLQILYNTLLFAETSFTFDFISILIRNGDT